MKRSHIAIIVALLLLLFPLLIMSKEITLFENTTTNVSLIFFNPGNDTENSTDVWFGPFECAYDSRMNVTGEYVDYTDDATYEVILVTDLSDSMDYCIQTPEVNDSIPWEDSYMFADTFGEGSTDQKWVQYAGNWYTDYSLILHSWLLRPGTLGSDPDRASLEIRGMKFGNYSMEFTANIPSNYFILYFGKPQQNRKNVDLEWGGGGYHIQFNQNRWIDLYDRGQRLEHVYSPVTLNTYRNYQIIVDNATIEVFINGNLIFSHINQGLGKSGYMGFTTAGWIYMDDVYVESLDHVYTTTEWYGYSSRVFGEAYLYENITLTETSSGTCGAYGYAYPPAYTSCAGLPYCTEQCQPGGWETYSCPGCLTGSTPTSGTYIYCSPNSNHACCALGYPASRSAPDPNNCCWYIDPSSYSWCSASILDSSGRPSCNAADWANNQIQDCITYATDSYCNVPRVRQVDSCMATGTAANCVGSACTSYVAPVAGALCLRDTEVTSYTDAGCTEDCTYGDCPDPHVRCDRGSGWYETGFPCSPPPSNYCRELADGSGYTTWAYDGNEAWREYWTDCPSPRYDWDTWRYRPYRTTWCHDEMYYYCTLPQGDFSPRNDFWSMNVNDSGWGNLYDYTHEFRDYYLYTDGRDDDNENDWICEDCARFYRKKFNLTENIAFGKPVTQYAGSGCASLSRVTDGRSRADDNGEVSSCGAGPDGIQVDLGASYNLSAVSVIMRYTGGNDQNHRSYYIDVLVSDDPTFSTSSLLWDASVDGPLEALPEGNLFNINEGVRYIRVLSDGYDLHYGAYSSTNEFVEIEALRNIAVEDVTDLRFSFSLDNGLICYLNGHLLNYTRDASTPTNAWGRTHLTSPTYLVNGTNILACQNKENSGSQGFNAELRANTNSLLVHRASNYRFHQQERLCAGETDNSDEYRGSNPYSYRDDPDSNTCEYAREVESCQGYYPYTAPTPLVVTGWSALTTVSYYHNYFLPALVNIASSVGGELGLSGFSTAANINHSIWRGDIIVFDGHDLSTSDVLVRNYIGRALSEGKTIITEWDRVNHLLTRGEFTFTDKREVSSFDHYAVSWNVTYSNGTHSGTGVIIADQYNQLSYSWRRYDAVKDILDKSANLVDALRPVWGNKTIATPVHASTYCLQSKPNSGCEVCLGIKEKLAVANDNLFIDMTVGRRPNGVKVGLVTFGTRATNCIPSVPLTNRSDVLKDSIATYNALCGATCLACAIQESLTQLSGVLNNNISDSIVLMTDGKTNTLLSGATGQPILARAEALTWACDSTKTYSAVSKNVTIHSIYYGDNSTAEGRDAMELLENISNCTGGLFVYGNDPDSIEDAYRLIIGELGTGFPKPKLRFGVNQTLPGNIAKPWDLEWVGSGSLEGSRTWWNRSCGPDMSCINLMTAFNREILACVERNLTDYDENGCTVRINGTSIQSGIIHLSDLHVDVINASKDPVAYPYELPTDFEMQMCPLDMAECGNGILDYQFGEQCENRTHCAAGESCIPPLHGGACSCTDSSLIGVCGNGIIDPGEQCDSQASFEDFSCYPPGSVIHPPGYGATGYDLSCKIRSGDPCGNGAFDIGEECDPTAPSPYNDEACSGDYRCIPPGVDSSCTCVKPMWNIHAAGGGTLYREVPQAGTLTDINLLNHAVSPLFPRNQLTWSLDPSSNESLANFSITGTYLRTLLGEGFGLVNVTVWVHDPLGYSDNFTLLVNITGFVPRAAIGINSSIIATSHKIINTYYEDTVSGKMTEIGPYLFTMKVFRDE